MDACIILAFLVYYGAKINISIGKTMIFHESFIKTKEKKKKALSSLLMKGLLFRKSGGLLLSRIALQYHRRRRA